MSYTREQYEDMISLYELRKHGGLANRKEIPNFTNAEEAEILGWSMSRHATAVRLSKEYPEVGIHLASTRGRKPSKSASRGRELSGDAALHVEMVTESGFLEGIRRMARIAGQSYASYNNLENKKSVAAQRRKARCLVYYMALNNFLATLDPETEDEMYTSELIRNIQKVAPV